MLRFLIPVVLTSVTVSGQTANLRNPRTSPEDVAIGAKTFRSHCASCHGVRGEGGIGPALAAGRFFHGSTDADLLQNISEGIPGTAMPGLFYSPDRIWQIVAYIRSINQSTRADVAGNVEAGAELFRSNGCGQCHRMQGDGGRMGPDLTYIGKSRSPEYLRDSIMNPNADVQPRYWVVEAVSKEGTRYSGFLLNEDTYTVQFLDFEEHLRSLNKSALVSCEVEKNSRMPSYRGKLKDSQIQDLVAYLSSLKPRGDSE